MGFPKASMIRGKFRPGVKLWEFPENQRSRRPRPSEYVRHGMIQKPQEFGCSNHSPRRLPSVTHTQMKASNIVRHALDLAEVNQGWEDYH